MVKKHHSHLCKQKLYLSYSLLLLGYIAIAAHTLVIGASKVWYRGLIEEKSLKLKLKRNR